MGRKKSLGPELADPNATFFPDPDNPTQYFCKICKFKIHKSELYYTNFRNHRLSQHRNSNIWKYFAFDPNDQKFCTCSICGNNIEVNPNTTYYGNTLKSHLISNHQIHFKQHRPYRKVQTEILDEDTGLMKPLPGPKNQPVLKIRNEGIKKETWQHFNSLDDASKVSCKICLKIITGKNKKPGQSNLLHYYMYKHLKEHNISLEKKYACSYCGKCF